MLKPARTHALLAAALLASPHAFAVESSADPGAGLTTPTRTRLYRNVKDFGAVGDGKADDTAAIQKAIDHNQGNKLNKPGGVVYLPAGVYKVTKRLNMWWCMVLMGDPRDPPTILLPSGTPDFQDPARPNPVIVTWNGYNADPSDAWFQQVPIPEGSHEPSGASVNNTFFSGIRHLKIRIEAGNPGAVGIHGRLAQQTILEGIAISAVDAKCGIMGSAHLYKDIVIEGCGTGFYGTGPSAWSFRNVVFRNIAGPALPAPAATNEPWAWVTTSNNVAAVPAGEGGPAYLACELANPDPYGAEVTFRLTTPYGGLGGSGFAPGSGLVQRGEIRDLHPLGRVFGAGLGAAQETVLCRVVLVCDAGSRWRDLGVSM